MEGKVERKKKKKPKETQTSWADCSAKGYTISAD